MKHKHLSQDLDTPIIRVGEPSKITLDDIVDDFGVTLFFIPEFTSGDNGSLLSVHKHSTTAENVNIYLVTRFQSDCLAVNFTGWHTVLEVQNMMKGN